jgi:tartrate-resistant acid phosphatase type 5
MASYIKYREPYIYVAGLSDTSALIAWGKFFFNEKNQLVDDDSLVMMMERRRSSIGEGSESYGEHAVLTVTNTKTGKVERHRSRKKNYCWIEGLSPDTEYHYELKIDDEPWPITDLYYYVKNKKRIPLHQGYEKNVFRTFPAGNKSADVTFAVIGDFGKSGTQQEKVAEALIKAVDDHGVRFLLTTGDNIYKALSGVPREGTQDPDANKGADDDDWFYTFFQPYRFLINRVPVFPAIGNHDTGESDVTDDRGALYDNLFIAERFPSADVLTKPGLTYRFRFGADVEFVSIDSSKEEDVMINGQAAKARSFLDDRHKEFLERVFENSGGQPRWRIPFLHHPPYTGGMHPETREVKDYLVPLWEGADVRIMFCGHDHNCQYFTKQNSHDATKPAVHYFLTGGGGDPRSDEPLKATTAELVAWGGIKKGHFLLVTIKGGTMKILPIDEDSENLELFDRGKKPWIKEISISI